MNKAKNLQNDNSIIILGLIVVGVLAGGISGWYFGESMIAVGWLGDLFLNALKMTIVPLVASSVICGVVSMKETSGIGRMGGVTLVYYMTTTAVAVFIGLVVVNIVQPGAGLSIPNIEALDSIRDKTETGISDIVLSLVSPNLVKSAADGQLLPIIIFSIMLAIAMSQVGKKADHLAGFFEGLNEAVMVIVTWIMYFAPVGIFALIAARLGKAGGGDAFFSEIEAVGWHVFTVLSGLTIHFVFLSILLFLITRHGIGYYLGMFRALFTAFGTASSSATLPITMECAKENGISDRSVRFVLPLGATVNMDGTALYEAAAVMFIAQAYGADMGVTQQVIIFITATLAAIGAAGIPEAGLVTMVIVLQAVHLPLDGIALLLAVDWLLDRFRTSLNVWGDAVGAAVIDKLMAGRNFSGKIS
ncbi:MAG: dicarboxylate/amino acid:cation symporter [Nitrospinota bacterium]|nr:dicarboxylate/amino acid:cation symporter [Nitrospinota bacterium]